MRLATSCLVLAPFVASPALANSAAPSAARSQEEAPPSWERLGGGSSGEFGPPELVYAGSPVCGEPFRVRLVNGPPNTHGCAGFSFVEQELPLPFFDVTAFIGFPLFALEVFVLDEQGRSPWMLEWAASGPVLCGSSFVIQGMLDDPSGPGAATFSDARRVTFGEAATGPQFPAQRYPISFDFDVSVACATVGDFDDDGSLDVVAVSSNTVPTFVRGSGDATLDVGPVSPVFAVDPKDCASADFDLDGCLDVVVTNAHPSFHHVEIYSGACDGTFALTTSIDVGFAPQLVATGDLDGNGFSDLVVKLQLEDQLHVLLGGRNGFVATSTVPLNDASNTVLDLADVDADRILDIVTTHGPVVSVHRGQGDGTFLAGLDVPHGANAASIAVIDVDGNGLVDFIATAPNDTVVRVALQTTPLTFAAPVESPTEPFLGTTHAVDVDGDGLGDLVAESDSEQLLVLLGRPDGSLQHAATLPSGQPVNWIGSGDLDGDGRPELLAGTVFDGAIAVHQSGATGFRQPLRTALGDNAPEMVSGDWNRDGWTDFAVYQNNLERVRAFLSDGAGGFGAPLALPDVGPVAILDTADLTGDLDPELIAADEDGLVVFRGGPGGAFSQPFALATQHRPTDVATADFDGDGWTDVVVASTEFTFLGDVYAVEVRLRNPNGSFRPPTLLAGGAEPTFVAVGDFDGDGNADVALASRESSSATDDLFVHFGDGNGGFGAGPVEYEDMGVRAARDLVVADLDDDGDDDLLVAKAVSPGTAVILGAPERALVAGAPVAGRERAAIADMDGDDVLDLVVAADDDGFFVQFGVGDGSFDRVLSLATFGGNWGNVAVADFTDDGLPDLLVTSPAIAEALVFENGLFGR